MTGAATTVINTTDAPDTVIVGIEAQGGYGQGNQGATANVGLSRTNDGSISALDFNVFASTSNTAGWNVKLNGNSVAGASIGGSSYHYFLDLVAGDILNFEIVATGAPGYPQTYSQPYYGYYFQPTGYYAYNPFYGYYFVQTGGYYQSYVAGYNTYTNNYYGSNSTASLQISGLVATNSVAGVPDTTGTVALLLSSLATLGLMRNRFRSMNL